MRNGGDSIEQNSLLPTSKEGIEKLMEHDIIICLGNIPRLVQVDKTAAADNKKKNLQSFSTYFHIYVSSTVFVQTM